MNPKPTKYYYTPPKKDPRAEGRKINDEITDINIELAVLELKKARLKKKLIKELNKRK